MSLNKTIFMQRYNAIHIVSLCFKIRYFNVVSSSLSKFLLRFKPYQVNLSRILMLPIKKMLQIGLLLGIKL